MDSQPQPVKYTFVNQQDQHPLGNSAKPKVKKNQGPLWTDDEAQLLTDEVQKKLVNEDYRWLDICDTMSREMALRFGKVPRKYTESSIKSKYRIMKRRALDKSGNASKRQKKDAGKGLQSIKQGAPNGSDADALPRGSENHLAYSIDEQLQKEGSEMEGLEFENQDMEEATPTLSPGTIYERSKNPQVGFEVVNSRIPTPRVPQHFGQYTSNEVYQAEHGHTHSNGPALEVLDGHHNQNRTINSFPQDGVYDSPTSANTLRSPNDEPLTSPAEPFGLNSGLQEGRDIRVPDHRVWGMTEQTEEEFLQTLEDLQKWQQAYLAEENILGLNPGLQEGCDIRTADYRVWGMIDQTEEEFLQTLVELQQWQQAYLAEEDIFGENGEF
ncbi:hypothetical protein HYFRA_00009012 [Hymenoscyphus fraxineus]|uniref:Uncharacterized protein n=1 Tax=Hymenoscyphus fraxineus TaxID=746836 RepID=A0A9N9KU86_9HELO|nr:hypothetical protein HYFRA_00009012 [Hymenoscyphus fraxineus]